MANSWSLPKKAVNKSIKKKSKKLPKSLNKNYSVKKDKIYLRPTLRMSKINNTDIDLTDLTLGSMSPMKKWEKASHNIDISPCLPDISNRRNSKKKRNSLTKKKKTKIFISKKSMKISDIHTSSLPLLKPFVPSPTFCPSESRFSIKKKDETRSLISESLNKSISSIINQCNNFEKSNQNMHSNLNKKGKFVSQFIA